MYSHHSEKGTNTATTPKFKLNDVLVEVDGWQLVRPLYPDIIGCQSYIVHIDCKREEPRTAQTAGVDMGMGTAPGVGEGKCTWFGKLPPDEIAGLEILHNGKI